MSYSLAVQTAAVFRTYGSCGMESNGLMQIEKCAANARKLEANLVFERFAERLAQVLGDAVHANAAHRACRERSQERMVQIC